MGDDVLARSIEDCPKKPIGVNQHTDYETRTYEIQVITPIFGGGSEAGKFDPKTPIRPSSIRGNLRFWWRATRGTRCDTVAELRQREGEIWGTTDWPSPVIIEIVQPEEIQPVNPQHYRNLDYALFPTREKKNPLLKEGLSFVLRVCWMRQSLLQALRDKENEVEKTEKSQIFKELDKDVKAAIWAWINFGGIGARTRRGCGALYCLRCKSNDQEIDPEIMPPSIEGFKSWMANCISKYELKHHASPNEWSTIGELHLRSGSSAISCWEASIRVLKDLRQGADLGRNGGHGRSRWPEAESIRELVLTTNDLKSRPGWHSKDQRMSTIALPAFPRAEFGMPIIIEIREERLPKSGVNIKPTLQRDEKKERMASPLILRPIKFRNSKFASMIIRLNKPPLDSAYLKPGMSDLARPCLIKSNQIIDSKFAGYKDSPMNRGLKIGSAVDAFLAYANEKGFLPVFP